MRSGRFLGRAPDTHPHGSPSEQQRLQPLGPCARGRRGAQQQAHDVLLEAFLPVEVFSLSVPADCTRPTEPQEYPGLTNPSTERVAEGSRIRDRSLHNIWQVSHRLRNPKQGDSAARADTTGAAVTSGRDSSPGARLEGQGQGCSQRSAAVFGGGKNNLSISLTAIGRILLSFQKGSLRKRIESIELLPHANISVE